MPNANDRADLARDYRLAVLRGQIDYASPKKSDYWFRERGAVRAHFPLVGTPISEATGDSIVAFVNLQLNPLSPLLSAVLVWDDVPIYRLDVGGPPHKDIPTPHRHFYRESDGAWWCEQVDLRAAGIRMKSDHCAVARYFFDWIGLDSGALVWQNPPPMQAPLKPNVMPRFASPRRKGR